MKKFFKYFGILIFLITLLLFNPVVRANFTESFEQVVDSLRGVERRANVIQVVQPPEIEIDLTNTQSEAVNLPQLLTEFSISPINYENGSCSAENYEEKHAAFAKLIIDGLNVGNNQDQIVNMSYDSELNRVQEVMNNWASSNPLSFEVDNYFAFLKWNNIESTPFSSQVFVNNENITSNASGLSTSNYQFSFKEDVKDYEVYIEITDAFNRVYRSNTVNIINTKLEDSSTTTTTTIAVNKYTVDSIELENTSLALSDLITSESSVLATFEGEISNNFSSNSSSGTFTWTAGKNTAGYKIEFNGKTVYTTEPSVDLINLPTTAFEITLSITLISFDGTEGNTSGFTVSQQNQNNSSNQENSQQGPTREQLEEQWANNLININGYWVTQPHQIKKPKINGSVESLHFDGRNIFIKIPVPSDYNYLVISADGSPYMITNIREDYYVEQFDKTFNLSFLAFPEAKNYTIRAHYTPYSYSDNLISFEISLENNNQDVSSNQSSEFSNPDLFDSNFKPNWISQNKEKIRSEVHGPTQMYITWDTLNTREDTIKTKSFRIYADGKCIGEQQSWNPAIGEDGKNDVAIVNSALIYNLPQETNINFQVRAVGFNEVESEPLEINVRTYREPRRNIVTAGVVDSGMVVFGEYAYIYYGLDLTKADYDTGENNTRIYAMLCCDEKGKEYLVSSVFVPIPDTSSCSDLLLVRDAEVITPAFLGAKTDVNLSITEFVELANQDVGLQASGIEIGDTIYKINGVEVYGEFELASQLSKISAGDEVEIEIKRGSELIIQKVIFDTYPENLNVEGLIRATGCYDPSGMAVGVLKIEMKEDFSRSQLLKSIYVLEEDKNANDIIEFQDSQYFYKEFNSNNNIYIGIDPFQDSQGVYGRHSLDLSNVKFNIYTNTQRETNRPIVAEEIKFSPETQDSPYDGTPGSWQDYYDLFGYEPPVVRGISDCCPDGGFMDIYGRMWDTNGVRTFQLDVNPPVAIPNWNVSYQKCEIIILKEKPEVGYFWMPRADNVIAELETPIVEKQDIYGMDTSCFFDIFNYNQYKYVAWRTNVCYVNEENEYFCMAMLYQAIAREQYIAEFER